MLLMLNLESENQCHGGAYDQHNNHDVEITEHFLIFMSMSVITTLVSSVVVGRDNKDNTSKSFVFLIAVTNVSIDTFIIHYYYRNFIYFTIITIQPHFEVVEHVSMLKNNHHQAMNIEERREPVQVFAKGENASLSCNAVYPAASFVDTFWTFNGSRIVSNERRRKYQENNWYKTLDGHIQRIRLSLTIYDVGLNDTGIYACYLNTSHGMAQKNFSIFAKTIGK